jgi:homoserine kinase
MKKVTVTTPASTANLGAGFDCLALALARRNVIELTDTGAGSGLEITAEGEGASRVPLDERNLIYRAAAKVFDYMKQGPTGRLRIHAANHVPLGSGMGSSAATVVGGLAAANALVGAGLALEELLAMAHELEGHPDNAAAALYGGLTLVSAPPGGGGLRVRSLAVPPMQVVIALPDVRLSTAEARAALPAQVPLTDAVFNIGHALFTVQALTTGDADLLAWALDDRLHQPYRQKLIPGFQAVVAAAKQAGASAVALSGAGPSLVAFAPANHAAIAAAMQAAFAGVSLTARTFVLDVDARGAEVVVEGA